jgi:N6-L-threonylcarbamoyladenine synthase
VVKSQINLHSKFHGVVPEVAARAHVKFIRPVVEKAISLASKDYTKNNSPKLTLNNIDYIAITRGPGLIPSLIVGVEFARALSLTTGKTIIPVNHLAGHLYSPFANSLSQGLKAKDIFPVISLIVSGGHTILVLIKNITEYRVLGQTVDDAAGEAFDKVAKLLNLPYPGGPQISKLAEKGDENSINFPKPMLNSKDYNFSFSGLKTAVLYYLQKQGQNESKNNIAASFQHAAVEVLVTKTMRAAREFKAHSVALSGGVAANKNLRKMLDSECKSLKLNFFVPRISLCTDNAEMIGMAAGFMLHNGLKPKKYSSIIADPNLEL